MTGSFERTTCACAQCVDCCKRQPGPLAPGELARIVAHVGEPADQNFVASAGARAIDLSTGRIVRIGTITPRYDAARQCCVFLGDDDRCRIHAIAPSGCALFDMHMNEVESQRRSVWLHRSIQDDPDYARDRAALPPSDSKRPMTDERVPKLHVGDVP